MVYSCNLGAFIDYYWCNWNYFDASRACYFLYFNRKIETKDGLVLFDNEKIEILYVFKKRFIYLNGIKNCELQESGIRNYPWGFYYHIITNKPDWRDIKIPQTDIVDYWLNKHLKRK